MGYSLTLEQSQKLRDLEREGRRCSWSTGRGGCFNRATISVRQESWPYELGKAGTGHTHDMPTCARHARLTPAGYEGRNFRVVSISKL